MPCICLLVLEVTYYTLVNTALMHFTGAMKVWVRLKAGKRLAAGPGWVLGPYDLADPSVFKVSGMGKDIMWSLWQAPKCTSLGFWSNYAICSSELYSILKNYKRSLECYWTLVETEAWPWEIKWPVGQNCSL